MSELRAGPRSERFAAKVSSESHFSWQQTQLALENTMLALIYSAATRIGFGFAIVQFIDHLHDLPGERAALLPNAPWLLGLALILCGVLVLVTALRNHRWRRRDLASGEFAPIAGLLDKRMHVPVYSLAIVLTLIGIFVFCAVLLHLV